ncbi:hypothetical protein SAMN05444050_3013 [Afipia sp. GAS231]|nr:hypothetical protein SAMN05444050_3013 [Afipia sp. GAS231]
MIIALPAIGSSLNQPFDGDQAAASRSNSTSVLGYYRLAPTITTTLRLPLWLRV